MTIVLIIWLGLLLLGTPIYISLGIASLLNILISGFSPLTIPQRVLNAANSFPLLAAPFFILMGNVMNTSGVTRRIFNFANVLVGWLRGGLGHANVVASVFFAGMSGSAVADAGGLGTIEIAAMKEGGYDVDFSAGITAASSVIGPIIPPSLPMVIYAVLADTSVGGLFIGGVIPGLLMAVSLMIMVAIFARKRKYPKNAFPTPSVIWKAFKNSVWALLAPAILFLGIASGIFTPTEAAIVAAFYAIILGLFVYKEFSVKDLPKMIIMTVETNGVVLALVMTAVLFGWNLAVAGIPQALGNFLTSVSRNPFVIIAIINVFLLIVGCFMEGNAAQMILVPILAPIAQSLGINPIQLGILIVLNLMVGTITPPVGIVLYVTANVAQISFERVLKATLPFLIPLVIVLLLVSYVPAITTFLPNLVMGK
ncbi:MAG: TRAP transporter large permease [Spirochaetales bacterium]|jgi:tripartite ATP-independent transporter DctM subunit|nr:TRAP transporter large permease [Spirochaetales bacterium]